ncbi:MAG: DUF1186 domain-containing protein [Lachnospiraceae bacterium]|nr:DUF1186 domain-containing protein [Lachnospiraceae bacterium]
MVTELQSAIEVLSHADRIFPRAALETVAACKEEAIPILRASIESAMEDVDSTEDDLLCFYSLFLLGEFQDREFFPKFMELATMPREELDYVLGDVITAGFNDILYNTYNGDLALLKKGILNENADEYARSALLDVMGQLYLDGTIGKQDWKEFLKEGVHSGEEYSYFYDALANVICDCHFVDMLSEIKYLYDNGLMNLMTLGEYADCVDYMFEYRDSEKKFCDTPIQTIDMLQGWAMFEDEKSEQERKEKRKEYERLLREKEKEEKNQKKKGKIGRNDPCPCGSGKKYKHCCLNKPKSLLDQIESEEERKQCLREYPYIGEERQEGREYLEDYFDADAIEIDRILYLGLKHRPGLIWNRNEEKEEKRSVLYLEQAFELFVKKTKKEEIRTFSEYDQKYSIHYTCKEWMGKFLDLLEKNGNRAIYEVVEKVWREMNQ